MLWYCCARAPGFPFPDTEIVIRYPKAFDKEPHIVLVHSH